MDDSWHVLTYSTSGGYVDNVVKIVIVFEEFPSREISVKDLAVHICMSTGMYVKCIKCMRNITVKAAVNTQANAIIVVTILCPTNVVQINLLITTNTERARQFQLSVTCSENKLTTWLC